MRAWRYVVSAAQASGSGEYHGARHDHHLATGATARKSATGLRSSSEDHGRDTGPQPCRCLPHPGRVAAYSDRRSEEHTSELQSLMRISYAVFCSKKKKINILTTK